MAGEDFGQTFVNTYMGFARMNAEEQARRHQIIQDSVRNAMEQHRIELEARRVNASEENYANLANSRDAAIQSRDLALAEKTKRDAAIDRERMLHLGILSDRNNLASKRLDTNTISKIEQSLLPYEEKLRSAGYTEEEIVGAIAEKRNMLYEAQLGRTPLPVVTEQPQEGGTDLKGYLGSLFPQSGQPVAQPATGGALPSGQAPTVAARLKHTEASTDYLRKRTEMLSKINTLKDAETRAKIALDKAHTDATIASMKLAEKKFDWQKSDKDRRFDFDKYKFSIEQAFRKGGRQAQEERHKMTEHLAVGKQEVSQAEQIYVKAKDRYDKAMNARQTARELLKQLPDDDTTTRPQALAIINRYISPGPDNILSIKRDMLNAEHEWRHKQNALRGLVGLYEGNTVFGPTGKTIPNTPPKNAAELSKSIERNRPANPRGGTLGVRPVAPKSVRKRMSLDEFLKSK